MSSLKHVDEANEIENKIKNFEYGKSGSRFPTVRELANKRNISLVTAHKVVTELRVRGLLELKGKKFYIVYGRVKKESELGRTKQNNKIIGLHITNLSSSFFADLARAVEKSAKKEGYNLVIASSAYNYDEEKQVLKMFYDIGICGVISCPGTDSRTYKLYNSFALPYVFLGRTIESLNATAVLTNNYPVSKRIATHFAEQGFKNFMYIGLKELNENEDPRYLGFREGIIKCGFSIGKDNIFRIGYDELSRIENIAGAVLLRQKEPTAVFCFHDLIAAEVIKACNKYHLSIPEQVAIAGFDNLNVSKNCTPSLTTAGYRINEMADMAVSLLLKKLDEKDDAEANYYIDPMLIIRRSSMKQTAETGSDMYINDVLYKVNS